MFGVDWGAVGHWLQNNPVSEEANYGWDQLLSGLGIRHNLDPYGTKDPAKKNVPAPVLQLLDAAGPQGIGGSFGPGATPGSSGISSYDQTTAARTPAPTIPAAVNLTPPAVSTGNEMSVSTRGTGGSGAPVNALAMSAPTSTSSGTSVPASDNPWTSPQAIGGYVNAGTALLGGAIQSNAATEAAKLTSDAAHEATGFQREQFNQLRADSEPWRNAGGNAVTQVNALLSDPNYFQIDPSRFYQDPGFQYQLKEGLKAIQHSAAARGHLLSTGTMRAMNDYAQGTAEQGYNNFYNREMQSKLARLNGYQSVAGLGQTTVGQLGAAGQNYATNVGNLNVGAANALAEGRTGAANATVSGYVGAANSLNNGLSSYYNDQQNKALLKKLLGQS